MTENQLVVKFINEHHAEVYHVLKSNHKYWLNYYFKWAMTWLAIVVLWAATFSIIVRVTYLLISVSHP